MLKTKVINPKHTTDTDNKKMLSRWTQKEQKIKCINKVRPVYG